MKRIVLAGGGHAHLALVKSLRSLRRHGCSVVVVGPEPTHAYSGMGPGMLGGFYEPDDLRFPVQRMTESGGGEFIQDRVVSIDPHAKTVGTGSGRTLPYDVLSINVGSVVPDPLQAGGRQDVLPVKPIENLALARERLEKLAAQGEVRVAVAGGGAAGVETAGNVARWIRLCGGTPRVTLYAGRTLLDRFSDKARLLVRRSLQEHGVALVEGERVESLDEGVARSEAGTESGYDLALLAIGARPSPFIADSGLPVGGAGGLLVNGCLQSVAWPDIFGGGDCIDFQPQPLEKVGVHAVKQAAILLHNVPARALGEPLRIFKPVQKFMLIINLGDGTGLLFRPPFVFRSVLAMKLKDWIDRRFMRTMGSSA